MSITGQKMKIEAERTATISIKLLLNVLRGHTTTAISTASNWQEEITLQGSLEVIIPSTEIDPFRPFKFYFLTMKKLDAHGS